VTEIFSKNEISALILKKKSPKTFFGPNSGDHGELYGSQKQSLSIKLSAKGSK
jgi:hypothetical protein